MDQRTPPKQKDCMLIGIVGDEETCIGFLLAGIGEDQNKRRNFLIVEKQTTNAQIEKFVIDTMSRPDIAILLVAVDVANRIRHLLVRYLSNVSPIILEIPTKLIPYDVNKDPVIAAAKMLVTCEDTD